MADHREFSGHPLKLILHSVRCYPEKVQLDVNQLTGLPNLFIFVGPACSLNASQSLRLIEDAGIITLSPIPVNLTEDHYSWIPLSPSFTLSVSSARKFLASNHPGQAIGWIIENDSTRRDFYTATCQSPSAQGFSCLDPVYVDAGVTNLDPYLSASVLARADIWVFLYSTSSFTKLADLNHLLEKQSVILIDPQGFLLNTSTFPLKDFAFLGLNSNEIPPTFTHSYEKRYNEQNSLTSFRSYQAAEMILQALENTAIVFKDKSILLPRQGFLDELLVLKPTLQGLCFYPIRSYHINFQDQECP